MPYCISPSHLMAFFAAVSSSAPVLKIFCAKNTPPNLSSGMHSSLQTRITANDRTTTASYRPQCISLFLASSALPYTFRCAGPARSMLSWNGVFLRAAWSCVTSHCCLTMAGTSPGNPKPVPTSTTRSSDAAVAASTSSARTRLSAFMTHLSSTASHVQIAVRLYRWLSLSSRSVRRSMVSSRATSSSCEWAARRSTACVSALSCCVVQLRRATPRRDRA